ncbi:hypothetical protein EDI_024190 [Entamoeba dispar SAW760]|uniref:PH domain-containing protein n=1 Tax=Entamoeba dispar (strain ATCC PRA-260 / SAW760) TaxID=370354 RepID=B0EH83_ENTDS|nr:uncharacterized protein EDI_024190 [Entamoeba dispar SAW760]EDR26135.1 hypothetical protein EDI_024190 [Entamoeba dispar SAW760]|eukprot:EDR26135.1 hypothetical protein EDI_024190 [Entamoeba dispar SAW760]
MQNVSVAQLMPCEYESWGTKEGGGYKNWKKRYFVLKDKKLWYFDSKDSVSAKGYIELSNDAHVEDASDEFKGKCVLAINSKDKKGDRRYLIEVDNPSTLIDFIKHIENSIHPESAKKSYIDSLKTRGIPESIMSPKIQSPIMASSPTSNNNDLLIKPKKVPLGMNPLQMAMAGEMKKTIGAPDASVPIGSLSYNTNSSSNQLPAVPPINSGRRALSQKINPLVEEKKDRQQTLLGEGDSDVVYVNRQLPSYLGRNNINPTREYFTFLTGDKSKVLDYWISSIPSQIKLEKNKTINYVMSVASDCDNVTYKVNGPQENMGLGIADFFSLVESASDGIDKMNLYGNKICPERIGSYIQLCSAENAIEGGYIFCGDLLSSEAFNMIDSGNALIVLNQFEKECSNIKIITSVEKDMSSVGPQFTRFTFDIYGKNTASKIEVIKSVLTKFGCSDKGDQLMAVFQSFDSDCSLSVSLLLTPNDLAQMSIIINNPKAVQVSVFLGLDENKNIQIHNELVSLYGPPKAVECVLIMDGFKMGIYKQKLLVNVIYDIGYENSE